MGKSWKPTEAHQVPLGLPFTAQPLARETREGALSEMTVRPEGLNGPLALF